MSSQGVLVQIEHSVFGSIGGSALRVNNVVLTHGIHLKNLYYRPSNNKPNYCRNYSIKHENIMEDLKSSIQSFTHHYEENARPIMKFKVLSKRCSNQGLHENEVRNERWGRNSMPTEDYIIEEAKLCMLYNYKGFSNITREIPNWSLVDDETSDQNKIILSLLPTFLFLIVGKVSKDLFEKSLQIFYTSVRNNIFYPGLPLVIESTPFGKISFAKSWSQGIISKLIGPDNNGLLTDARLVIGCEGAPIYKFEDGVKGKLIGLVVLATPEYIGFSLGINLANFLKEVLGLHLIEDYIPLNKSKLKYQTSLVDEDLLKASIVFVRCLHKWGSGVVIDSPTGLIVTCSHIINHALDSVKVVCEGGQYPATVVYASPPNTPYDLALLTVGKKPNLKHLTFTEEPAVIGEKVVTVGYPLSMESLVTTNRTPTLSAGRVAKISSRGGPLHTTCCTYKGVSGGAIIRPPDQLLGIAVCNVSIEGLILPKFGLGISVDDFKKPISQYLKSRDPSCLQSLCNESLDLKMKWNLLSYKL